jgi:TrmH family RNA methyltransferase
MGALARVKVHYCDLKESLRRLSVDIPVYGTFLDGENIYTQELNPNGVILMGNEGRGISHDIAKYVTKRVLIPSFPPERPTSESLNVAVATSIVCAEFRRRVQKNG